MKKFISLGTECIEFLKTARASQGNLLSCVLSFACLMYLSLFLYSTFFSLIRAVDALAMANARIASLEACRWISCRKNTGYHATDPKIQTQGAERVRSRIATKHGGGSLKLSNALRTAERDAELYPGLGPSL
jgi:hypothetical protein